MGDNMFTGEEFKDWLFRYQYVMRVRRTDRSKKRFISALVADVAKFRQDIQVVEYNATKKNASRNIYVGDIEKADKIICSYYDTPPQSFGGYRFFNSQQQGKKTLQFILASTLLMVAVGIGGTLLYMNMVTSPFDISSPITLLAIVIFGIYFYGLGKVTQGLSRRNNLIRNTSSVLFLLSMAKEMTDKKTAFAFIDEGSYGEVGLEVLRQSSSPRAQLFYLDCIGASAPLHFIGQNISQKTLEAAQIAYEMKSSQVNYIFAADGEPAEYQLSPEKLNQKTLNVENLEKVRKLLADK
ncbi:hypothetical protein [Enterococcus sp. LJL90]